MVAIARERESGAMELLFYGPVDNVSYVIGKYSAQLTVYCLLIILYLICFFIISNIAGVQIPASFFMMMLLSLFTGAYLISVGVFVSTISKSVRSATLVFLTLIASTLLIQASQAWLSNIAGVRLLQSSALVTAVAWLGSGCVNLAVSIFVPQLWCE